MAEAFRKRWFHTANRKSARMASSRQLGGVIHTYQKYDPRHFPSPTQPPPDLVSSAFEHMLMYGSMRELSEEELARAVRLDPSQIAGLGPSLEALREMLPRAEAQDSRDVRDRQRPRRRRASASRPSGEVLQPPKQVAQGILDGLFATSNCASWSGSGMQAGGERSRFCPSADAARGAAGRQVPGRRTGRQVRVHRRTRAHRYRRRWRSRRSWRRSTSCSSNSKRRPSTAQIGVIDMDELSEFADPGDIEQLNKLQRADSGISAQIWPSSKVWSGPSAATA